MDIHPDIMAVFAARQARYDAAGGNHNVLASCEEIYHNTSLDAALLHYSAGNTSLGNIAYLYRIVDDTRSPELVEFHLRAAEADAAYLAVDKAVDALPDDISETVFDDAVAARASASHNFGAACKSANALVTAIKRELLSRDGVSVLGVRHILDYTRAEAAKQ